MYALLHCAIEFIYPFCHTEPATLLVHQLSPEWKETSLNRSYMYSQKLLRRQNRT